VVREGESNPLLGGMSHPGDLSYGAPFASPTPYLLDLYLVLSVQVNSFF